MRSKNKIFWSWRLAMNRRGTLIMYGIMMAFLVFITAVVLIEPLKDVTGIGRDVNHLDCNNTSISTGDKMSCIVVDSFLPGFLLACLAVAFAYFGIRALPEQQ